MDAMRLRARWACLSFLLLFAAGAAQAQTCGVLSNAGFESNLTGWAASGPVSIVSDVHSGARAARIGAAQGGVNRSGTFAVTAGASLTFSVWAKISGGPSWAGVGLDFLNASGTEISEINTQITSTAWSRSEEHTSELQSQSNLVCRLLLEKKKKKKNNST